MPNCQTRSGSGVGEGAGVLTYGDTLIFSRNIGHFLRGWGGWGGRGGGGVAGVLAYVDTLVFSRNIDHFCGVRISNFTILFGFQKKILLLMGVEIFVDKFRGHF